MQKSKFDLTTQFSTNSGLTFLVLYVDDIIITGSDAMHISSLKSILHGQFQTKGLGELKFFLELRCWATRKFLSQKKYVLDLLAKATKLRAKPCNTLMIPN